MVKFFRGWCEELILSSFIVALIEMLVPEGKTKKYIRVVTGVYMIFVILNSILINMNQINLEGQLENILDVSSTSFDEEKELEESYRILNQISENLQKEEEENVREVQE